jgi:hypothetical protein
MTSKEKDDYFEIESALIESFPNTQNNEESTYALLESKRESSLREWDDISRYNISNKRIHYISDLHLMHNLKQENLTSVSIITKYFRRIIKNMLTDKMDVILIAGDVASDYSVFELFVETLNKAIKNQYYSSERPIVIFVLGNHELWSFSGVSLDEIVKKYKNLLLKYKMFLLHNNIIYMDNTFSYKEIPSELLDSYSKNELREILKKSNTIFFGGLAFSGYNEEFNAYKGIYRDVIDRDTEIEETKVFESLYKKISDYLYDKNLVVVTHTPVECWMKEPIYHKNYIYVNGHTHKNIFYDDGEIRLYADNQVGYNNIKPQLKWFDLDGSYDIFADCNDGIFEISKDGYESFYRGKNIRMTFRWKPNKIYMLKKNGYYCFLHESWYGDFSILNGGKRKNLPYIGNTYQDVLRYYYTNMDQVIDTIKNPLDKYSSIQKRIADDVKKMGGSGNIHGCIIDIDFYNHLYVNPLDMKITTYYAVDIIQKTVFPSVPKLLETKRPDLLKKYNKLVESSKATNEVSLFMEEKENEEVTEYLDTDIYKASREIKKMQRLDSNILAIWVEPEPSNPMIEKKDLKDMSGQELLDVLRTKIAPILNDSDSLDKVLGQLMGDDQVRKMLRYIEVLEKENEVLSADELRRLANSVYNNDK